MGSRKRGNEYSASMLVSIDDRIQIASTVPDNIGSSVARTELRNEIVGPSAADDIDVV
jgi:hypothetical protein